MESEDAKSNPLVLSVLDGLTKLKAEDIVILDISKVDNAAFQWLVICEGTSNIHVKSIAESVEKTVREMLGERPYGVEGKDTMKWILMDYVIVVVHVFQKEKRSYYDLENLWGDSEIHRRINLKQETAK